MPRNRSEKLRWSSKAHAYADASEHWLKTKERGALGIMWSQLDIGVAGEIMAVCGRLPDCENESTWRRSVIVFIRKSYAT